MTPQSIETTRGYHREMSEFVCRDSPKYLKRVALKCQVLAIWKGGTECMENMMMKWKEKSAMLNGVEGPAMHPLN